MLRFSIATVYTLCSKKTCPTFSTVTWKSIIKFWWFLIWIFLTVFHPTGMKIFILVDRCNTVCFDHRFYFYFCWLLSVVLAGSIRTYCVVCLKMIDQLTLKEDSHIMIYRGCNWQDSLVLSVRRLQVLTAVRCHARTMPAVLRLMMASFAIVLLVI